MVVWSWLMERKLESSEYWVLYSIISCLKLLIRCVIIIAKLLVLLKSVLTGLVLKYWPQPGPSFHRWCPCFRMPTAVQESLQIWLWKGCFRLQHMHLQWVDISPRTRLVCITRGIVKFCFSSNLWRLKSNVQKIYARFQLHTENASNGSPNPHRKFVYWKNHSIKWDFFWGLFCVFFFCTCDQTIISLWIPTAASFQFLESVFDLYIDLSIHTAMLYLRHLYQTLTQVELGQGCQF